ncbi:MAG: creatininase family protein [Planctomycetes bacterium]|nr:creatininase family protein [Planctomycetota bacterium]
MRYEMMLPHQIRAAIDGNWPAVLPLGVLEYHGEHLAVGMDTLAVTRSLDILEKEMDLVILPPFYYGAGSHVVEPPEGKGTVHVPPEALEPFALGMFRSLLRIGFRNVHFIIHHQSENFVQGMPTDLAFKLAARRAIFEFLEKERGEGWWGDNSMADYYSAHGKGDNPFNWIQGHPLMDEKIIANYDFDHAAIGETSLMMALAPEGVDMAKLSTAKWYLRGAENATRAHGERALGMILARLRHILGKGA